MVCPARLPASATQADFATWVDKVKTFLEQFLGHGIDKTTFLPFSKQTPTQMQVRLAPADTTWLLKTQQALMPGEGITLAFGQRQPRDIGHTVAGPPVSVATLFTAIKENKETDVAGWLQNGQISDVNAQHKGTYAVIFAAYYGRGDIVRNLISSRADLTKVNQHDETALQAAEAGNQQAVVDILMRSGPAAQSTGRYIISNLPQPKGPWSHVNQTEIERALYTAFAINARNKVVFADAAGTAYTDAKGKPCAKLQVDAAEVAKITQSTFALTAQGASNTKAWMAWINPEKPASTPHHRNPRLSQDSVQCSPALLTLAEKLPLDSFPAKRFFELYCVASQTKKCQNVCSMKTSKPGPGAFFVLVKVNGNEASSLKLSEADVRALFNETVGTVRRLIQSIKVKKVVLKGVTRAALEKQPGLQELQNQNCILVFYHSTKASATAPSSAASSDERLPEFMLHSVPAGAVASQIVQHFAKQNINVEVCNLAAPKPDKDHTNAWIVPQTQADLQHLLTAWSDRGGKGLIRLQTRHLQKPVHMNLPKIRLAPRKSGSPLPSAKAIERALMQTFALNKPPKIWLNSKDSTADVTCATLSDYTTLAGEKTVQCGPTPLRSYVVFGKRSKHGPRKKASFSLAQQLEQEVTITLVWTGSDGKLQPVEDYLQQRQRQAVPVVVRLSEPRDVLVTR